MRQFIKCLNEYHTPLATIKMDKVYDGYKLYVTKVESCTSGIVYYEVSSNSTGTTQYKTLEEAMNYITEWQLELG